MAVVQILVANILSTWESIFSIAVVMWGLERLFCKEKISTASQLRSLRFWLFAGIGTAVAVTVYGLAGQLLNPRPLFLIPLNSWLASRWVHWSMYLIAPLLGMILYDFFGYWLHRAQHKWLWHLHAVHHSIEELSGINSYFHWTEQFFRIAFISLPAGYLVGIDGLESVFVVELLLKLQGYYLHSPNTIHLGSTLRRLIADNRFHRIHHSIEPRHFDKNFGAGTSIWDQLFGTAYFPVADEWPKTGINGRPEARTVSDYLWGPFLRKRTQASVEFDRARELQTVSEFRQA